MVQFYTGYIRSQNMKKKHYFGRDFPNEMDSPCRLESEARLEVSSHKLDHYLANIL